MFAMTFLPLHRADAPLIVSIPHTGTDIPADIEATLVSPWLARKDADWWVERLYDFAAVLGAKDVHLPTLEHARHREDVADVVVDDQDGPAGEPGAGAARLADRDLDGGGEVLLDPRAQGRGLLEPGAVEALVREHDARGGQENVLFALLMLELWFKKFVDAPVAVAV